MNRQIIHAGWLIDGTGAAAKKNMRLTIDTDRFVSIDSVDSEVPYTENTCLDLSGYTLLPTLCDCHTHLAISGSLDPAIRKMQGSLKYEATTPIISKHIDDYLNHGVLCVRDGGDKKGFVLHHKNDCSKLNRIPFEIQTSGTAWHLEGRYGKFIGNSVSKDKNPIPAMNKWIEKGIDHIKVVQSGLNSLTMFGKQTDPQFDKNTISRIFSLCRTRGIGLMIHANGEKPVRIAIEGGCNSIEHGFFMGDENLKKMADARITWVPTAVTMKAYVEQASTGSVEFQVARKTLDHQLAQLQSARRYGVPVCLGTDAGSPGVCHGKAVGEELGLLVSAGYSIEEAVGCASGNAAALLKSDYLGHLVMGAPASFVAVEGRPSQVPEQLSNIDMIMVSGKVIKTKIY